MAELGGIYKESQGQEHAEEFFRLLELFALRNLGINFDMLVSMSRTRLLNELVKAVRSHVQTL